MVVTMAIAQIRGGLLSLDEREYIENHRKRRWEE